MVFAADSFYDVTSYVAQNYFSNFHDTHFTHNQLKLIRMILAHTFI